MSKLPETKMIKVFCVSRKINNLPCDSTCGMIFPDRQFWKNRMRDYLKLMKENCPYKKYGIVPKFQIIKTEEQDEDKDQ